MKSIIKKYKQIIMQCQYGMTITSKNEVQILYYK